MTTEVRRAVAWENQISAVVASSQDGSYPDDNLLLYDLGQLWKTSGSVASATLTATQTTGSGDRYVVLDNHNLIAGDTVNVAYSHASGAQSYNLAFNAGIMAKKDTKISAATSTPVVTITNAISKQITAGFLGILKCWDWSGHTVLPVGRERMVRNVEHETQGGARHSLHLSRRPVWNDRIPVVQVADVATLEAFLLHGEKRGPIYYIDDVSYPYLARQVRMTGAPSYNDVQANAQGLGFRFEAEL